MMSMSLEYSQRKSSTSRLASEPQVGGPAARAKPWDNSLRMQNEKKTHWPLALSAIAMAIATHIFKNIYIT